MKDHFHHYLVVPQMIVRVVLIYFFALLPLQLVIAQTPYLFWRYGTEDGLSHAWVSDIFQDSRGFIWIATQYGLNRFDGHSFTVFTYNSNDSMSLSSNWVRSITEDKNGKLWVGTFGTGVNCFDPNTEMFARYLHDPSDPESLPGMKINNVFCDPGGRIWVGTPEGLCRYVPESDAFKRYTLKNVSDITVDTQGRLYISTAEGLFYWDAHTDTLISESLLSEKSVSSTHSAGNQIWVFADAVLQSLEGHGDRKIISYPLHADIHEFGHINSPILSDSQGSLWVGGQHGLAVRGAQGMQWVYFAHRALDPWSLTSGNLTCLTEDRSGNIWIGTNQGISVYASHLNRFRRSVFEPAAGGIPLVREVLVVNGEPWIATTEGVYRASLTAPFERQLILERTILSLSLASDGYVYAGAGNAPHGFYRIHPVTHQRTFFGFDSSEDDSMIGGMIWGIKEDSAGRLWISAGDHLQCFRPADEAFIHFYSAVPEGAIILDVLIDHEDNLWIATLSDGLYFLPKANTITSEHDATFINYRHHAGDTTSLSSDIVLSLFSADDGVVWIGTDGGLNRFQNGIFHRVLQKDGLLNDKILGITGDARGRLWMSTIGHGIICYDPAEKQFYNFNKKDGLYSNDFMVSSVFRDESGMIFFGSEGGLQIFHPENIFHKNTTDVSVFFTGFQIHGRPVPIGKGSPLKQSILFTEKIVLPPGNGTFSLQFAAQQFVQQEKTAYSYLLEGGREKEQGKLTRPEINFSSLSAGDYTLTIRTANTEQDWEAVSIPLSIEVLAPWWASRLAYASYALLLALGILALYRYQLRRKLESAGYAKLKEINAARSKFFTYVTHEFRTPLTVILGYAGQIAEEDSLPIREKAGAIRRSGKYLLHLVNQMLDLAKLEANTLSGQPVLGDVLKFLKYAIEPFQTLATSKNIRLHFLSGVHEYHMDFDPDNLLKVVSNLLSNAIKFTPANGDIYISVEILPLQDTQKKIFQISVRDTGKGIAQKDIPYVFDPFFRADKQPSDEGSGIGLALSKELAKLMGGDLSVSNEPEKGAEFVLWLPVTRNAANSQEWFEGTFPENITMEMAEPTAQPAGTSTGKADWAMVLIVEDHVELRRYLTSCLENDYQVLTVPSGEEGIAHALEFIPDLIVSDVMLPGIDGMEVCAQLKADERTNHIPIILLTAKTDMPSRLAGLERGADAYLAKPIEKEELIAHIRGLIASRLQLRLKYRNEKQEKAVKEVKEDPLLLKIRKLVEDNLEDENYGMPQICKSTGLGRVQIWRKMKALTGYSPSDFIRRIRMEQAHRLLLHDNLTAAEVGYKVGFKDPAYFSRVFSEFYGYPPGETRK